MTSYLFSNPYVEFIRVEGVVMAERAVFDTDNIKITDDDSVHRGKKNVFRKKEHFFSLNSKIFNSNESRIILL